MKVRFPLSVALGAWILLLMSMTAGAADVATITHGREVDLEDHLVPGKYVLFDFYADWCGPCRSLEPRLLDLAGRHNESLALRKVDIINWDSAVARQYRLSSIPHLVLYGPDGNRLAAGDAGSVLHRLQSSLGDGGTFVPAAGGGSSIIPLVAVSAIFVIAAALVIRRRRPAHSPTPVGTGIADLGPVDTTTNPGDPAIWFAMLQGSLQGPFTRAQLSELVRRGTVEKSTTVRRRGDATWRAVDEVLD